MRSQSILDESKTDFRHSLWSFWHYSKWICQWNLSLYTLKRLWQIFSIEKCVKWPTSSVISEIPTFMAVWSFMCWIIYNDIYFLFLPTSYFRKHVDQLLCRTSWFLFLSLKTRRQKQGFVGIWKRLLKIKLFVSDWKAYQIFEDFLNKLQVIFEQSLRFQKIFTFIFKTE